MRVAQGVLVHGLWVPESEQARFEAYGELDGLLDIDTRKAATSLNYFPDRRVAIDVGAHVGSTATFLAKHFEKVEAFEAVKDVYDLLVMNAGAFPNITCHHVAAAAEPGELSFEIIDTHTQLSHALLPGEEKHFDKGRIIGPFPALPLDHFALKNVSFIKIDVEGAELGVVQGLRNTILESRPVILMEQAGNEAKFHGRKAFEASDYLTSLGMEIIPDFPFGKDRLFRFPD